MFLWFGLRLSICLSIPLEREHSGPSHGHRRPDFALWGLPGTELPSQRFQEQTLLQCPLVTERQNVTTRRLLRLGRTLWLQRWEMAGKSSPPSPQLNLKRAFSRLDAPSFPFHRAFTLKTCHWKFFLCSFELCITLQPLPNFTTRGNLPQGLGSHPFDCNHQGAQWLYLPVSGGRVRSLMMGSN